MTSIKTASPPFARNPQSPPRSPPRSPKMQKRMVGDLPRLRNLLGFSWLGLLNNVVFIFSNASAGTVLPGAVGLVYIINTAPGLLIKALAPLWIDWGSYDLKIFLVGLSLAFNLVVLLLPSSPTWLKLLGIALGDAGSSAGEASCMALSQFYAQPQRHISFFALGTGCAGVSGYCLRIFVLPSLGMWGQLGVGSLLVLAYWASYFVVLDTPWVDAEDDDDDEDELESGYEFLTDELSSEDDEFAMRRINRALDDTRNGNGRGGIYEVLPQPASVAGRLGLPEAGVQAKNASGDGGVGAILGSPYRAAGGAEGVDTNGDSVVARNTIVRSAARIRPGVKLERIESGHTLAMSSDDLPKMARVGGSAGNGLSDGDSNGAANGDSNGAANGDSNGAANGYGNCNGVNGAIRGCASSIEPIASRRWMYPNARHTQSETRLPRMRADGSQTDGRRKRHSHDGTTLGPALHQAVGHFKKSMLGASTSSLEGVRTPAELARADSVLRGRAEFLGGATLMARMRIIGSLGRYMVPLFTVFFAEYACQSGAWVAFALPDPTRLDDPASRDRAYSHYNLMYQVGVLLSRASGLMMTIPRPVLNAMVVVQVGMLLAFSADAATQLVTGWLLTLPSLVVGLIGGALYVHTFLAIDREVPADQREAALATCTCGDTAGVLVGEFAGLLMQACLFQRLRLPASLSCPISIPPRPLPRDLHALR